MCNRLFFVFLVKYRFGSLENREKRSNFAEDSAVLRKK